MAAKNATSIRTRSAGRTEPEGDSKLLELIVCVNLSDRLEAMEIRDSDGPAAAIKFLREACVKERAAAPASKTAAADDDDESRSEKYTLLLNPPDWRRAHLSDAIFAVRAIGVTLSENERNAELVLGLAGALLVVGEQLELALGSVNIRDQEIVRDALRQAPGSAS